MRGSYSGNTLAFQANADSSILLPRSTLRICMEKIGFFGDSYVDMIWHRHPNAFPQKEKQPWSMRLCNDSAYTSVSSGLGGTNQYYALRSWQKHLEDQAGICDYAIFTFTWEERLYHEDERIQMLLRGAAERRVLTSDDIEYANRMKFAIHEYYDLLYSADAAVAFYKYITNEILCLPAQYPDTKFIFLPNTEFARKLVLQKFQQGVLVNFSFEALSNHETGSPGPMPIRCGREGHLNDRNHDVMKDFVKNIIVNYKNYKNQILELELDKFDLSSLPEFPR